MCVHGRKTGVCSFGGLFFIFVFWRGLLLRFGVPGRLLKCDKKFEKIGFNMYKIENI